jgi:hypothetical protein
MRMMAAVAVLATMLGGCDYIAPTLPKDDGQAARACWPAASAIAMQDKVMAPAEMAEVMAYAAIAAKSVPGTKPYTDKTAAVFDEPIHDELKLGLTARNLLYQCRARFPSATEAAPLPPLPADPLDRNVWCLTAAEYMSGAMRGAKNTTYVEKDRYARVVSAARAALTDAVLSAHGLKTSDQFEAYRGTMAERELPLRLDRIAAACPDH